jgi:hypothetical protein
VLHRRRCWGSGPGLKHPGHPPTRLAVPAAVPAVVRRGAVRAGVPALARERCGRGRIDERKVDLGLGEGARQRRARGAAARPGVDGVGRCRGRAGHGGLGQRLGVGFGRGRGRVDRRRWVGVSEFFSWQGDRGTYKD